MLLFGKTDVGRKRQNNEDAFLIHHFDQPDCDLCIVCDGMGGVAGGEIASKTAIDAFFAHISREFEHGMPESIPDLLDDACQDANDAVREARTEATADMGTTLVAALHIQDTYYVINIGDSRLYCITSDEITQITHDHSWMQSWLDSGKSKEEAMTSPWRNAILKCVGTHDIAEADIFTVTLSPGDHDTYILLCSDGLTNYLSEEEILEILSTPEISLEEKVAMLVDGANAGGGGDNITAVVMADHQEDSTPVNGE